MQTKSKGRKGLAMAIERILSNLRIEISRPPVMTPMSATRVLRNINPYVPFPFSTVRATGWQVEEGVVCEADIAEEFIQKTILSRGRPHFSLTHAAFIDDAVAVAAYTGVTGEVYGERHRYIEMGAAVAFHREAFPRGSLVTRQFGTVEVNTFRVRWQFLPHNDRTSLLQRGVFQISILGIRDDEEIQVASVEGSYMRRKAVLATRTH